MPALGSSAKGSRPGNAIRGYMILDGGGGREEGQYSDVRENASGSSGSD